MAAVRLAVVGSRGFDNEAMVRKYVRGLPRDVVVVSGACKDSPDAWAVNEAKKRGMDCLDVPVDRSGLPKWPHGRREFARRAKERNQQIVNASDLLVAFWDGKSPGTNDSLTRARKARIPWAAMIMAANDEYRYLASDEPVVFWLEKRCGH